jgi:hypothetical protein
VQLVLVVPVCRLIAKFAGLMASQPELTNVKVTPLQPLATALFKPRSHIPVSYQYDDALMGHTFSVLPPVLAATAVKQDMVPSSPAKPPTALVGKEVYESTTRAVQVGFFVVVLVVDVVVVLVVVVVVVLVVVVVVVVVEFVGDPLHGVEANPGPTCTMMATDGTPFATTKSMYGPGGATLASGGAMI